MIVHGLVTRTELVKNALPSEITANREGLRVTFETIEALKGKPKKIDAVWANSVYEKDCIFQPIVGQEYLLVVLDAREMMVRERKLIDSSLHISVLGSQFLMLGFGFENAAAKEFNEQTLGPIRSRKEIPW